EQPLRQHDLLLVAAAEVPHPLARPAAGDAEGPAQGLHGGPSLTVAAPPRPEPIGGHGPDVLLDAHIQEQAGVLALLGEISDPGPDRVGRVAEGDGSAIDLDPTRRPRSG